LAMSVAFLNTLQLPYRWQQNNDRRWRSKYGKAGIFKKEGLYFCTKKESPKALLFDFRLGGGLTAARAIAPGASVAGGPATKSPGKTSPASTSSGRDTAKTSPGPLGHPAEAGRAAFK
jgi:hypothetical protein